MSQNLKSEIDKLKKENKELMEQRQLRKRSLSSMRNEPTNIDKQADTKPTKETEETPSKPETEQPVDIKRMRIHLKESDYYQSKINPDFRDQIYRAKKQNDDILLRT